jgi:hypothetical protein
MKVGEGPKDYHYHQWTYFDLEPYYRVREEIRYCLECDMVQQKEKRSGARWITIRAKASTIAVEVDFLP